jgi:hypothetical protein
MNSRVRDVSQGAEQTWRIPRPWRAGRVLQRIPGVRQGHDWLHWCRTAAIQYVDGRCVVLLENHTNKTVTVLTNLGEKMSDEEVDELLKAVDTTSGEINYTGTIYKACRLFTMH